MLFELVYTETEAIPEAMEGADTTEATMDIPTGIGGREKLRLKYHKLANQAPYLLLKLRLTLIQTRSLRLLLV